MVRFSRVWRALLHMGHPQVTWSVQLMTHNGGISTQFQGDCEGRGLPPLNPVECAESFCLLCAILRLYSCPGIILAPWPAAVAGAAHGEEGERPWRNHNRDAGPTTETPLQTSGRNCGGRSGPGGDSSPRPTWTRSPARKTCWSASCKSATA